MRDVNVQQGMEDGNIYRCGGDERRAHTMSDVIGVDRQRVHHNDTQRHTECNKDVVIKAKDVIRCRECGYRILMKKRTTKIVQFEAR